RANVFENPTMPAFAAAYAERPASPLKPMSGGDIHNRPALLILHYTGDCPAAEKGGGQIDIDNGLPVFQGKIFDFVTMQAATGDVDEDIDTAMIRDDSLKSLLYIRFPGYIQGDEHCLFATRPNFGRDLFPAFFIYI